MFTTWIVVGHRAGARIFEHRRAHELDLVSELDHAAGRLKNQAINSDRPGRAFDRKSPGRHAVGGAETPHEHSAEAFARELAHELNAARTENRFARLVLVAEPRFLGLLRAELDHVTASLVVGDLSKDLAKADSGEVRRQLTDAMLV
jgi:protein required for attachment to host cells